MGRKHSGKRRNCSLQAISPYPTVFSKGLFPRGVKRCHCSGLILDDNLKFDENGRKFSKRLWEKEKLLLTSNFSFSHNVFKRLVQQTFKNKGLFGKELRDTIQNAFFPESCPFFDLDFFLSSIKHPTAEFWYLHEVILLPLIIPT